jgi:hypothetical protein
MRKYSDKDLKTLLYGRNIFHEKFVSASGDSLAELAEMRQIIAPCGEAAALLYPKDGKRLHVRSTI